jgi:hypothetical protein
MKTNHRNRSDSIFEIASYGRRGPQNPQTFSSAEVEWIRRTVNRTPEVMLKVTSGGGAASARGIKAHFRYLGRDGDLDIETDNGQRLRQSDAGQILFYDWDLDLEEARRSVLHTDEPHPHVHMVVKAMSEQGIRLNIRKATLEGWRIELARHLRERGIQANASARAIRGHSRTTKKDGIYRAAGRGESTHMQRRVGEVGRDLAGASQIKPDMAEAKLADTQRTVKRAWSIAAQQLERQGERQLATQVVQFATTMPAMRTEKGALARAILQHANAHADHRSDSLNVPGYRGPGDMRSRLR